MRGPPDRKTLLALLFSERGVMVVSVKEMDPVPTLFPRDPEIQQPPGCRRVAMEDGSFRDRSEDTARSNSEPPSPVDVDGLAAGAQRTIAANRMNPRLVIPPYRTRACAAGLLRPTPRCPRRPARCDSIARVNRPESQFRLSATAAILAGTRGVRATPAPPDSTRAAGGYSTAPPVSAKQRPRRSAP